MTINILYNQYEEDSLSEELLIHHRNSLGLYTIKEDLKNKSEIVKISSFIEAINRKILSKTNKNSANFNNDLLNKPANRPTSLVNGHVSSMSNSQIQRQSQLKESMRMKNVSNSDTIKIYDNTTDVFKKRDKIIRTPGMSIDDI